MLMSAHRRKSWPCDFTNFNKYETIDLWLPSVMLLEMFYLEALSTNSFERYDVPFVNSHREKRFAKKAV